MEVSFSVTLVYIKIFLFYQLKKKWEQLITMEEFNFLVSPILYQCHLPQIK